MICVQNRSGPKTNSTCGSTLKVAHFCWKKCGPGKPAVWRSLQGRSKTNWATVCLREILKCGRILNCEGHRTHWAVHCPKKSRDRDRGTIRSCWGAAPRRKWFPQRSRSTLNPPGKPTLFSFSLLSLDEINNQILVLNNYKVCVKKQHHWGLFCPKRSTHFLAVIEFHQTLNSAVRTEGWWRQKTESRQKVLERSVGWWTWSQLSARVYKKICGWWRSLWSSLLSWCISHISGYKRTLWNNPPQQARVNGSCPKPLPTLFSSLDLWFALQVSSSASHFLLSSHFHTQRARIRAVMKVPQWAASPYCCTCVWLLTASWRSGSRSSDDTLGRTVSKQTTTPRDRGIDNKRRDVNCLRVCVRCVTWPQSTRILVLFSWPVKLTIFIWCIHLKIY